MLRAKTHTGSVLVLAISASLAFTLTACSGTASPDPGPINATNSPSEVEAALTPEDAVATRTVPLAGADVEVTVRPLVRADDLVVATLDFHGLPADGFISTTLLTGELTGIPAYSALRLLDLTNDQVFTVAMNSDDEAVATYADGRAGDGPEPRIQLAFAAPDAGIDSLGLFLPGGAYIDSVPIIDGDIPEPIPAEERYRPFDITTVVQAPVLPLESFTSELAGAVETLSSTEKVEVTLGSDVLFDVDADTLTKDAVDAVKGAAKHLKSREPGTIEIVGHTDDVASADYNQKLSERRAKAVAEELAKHIDKAQFPIETAGKGKGEPIVPNDSDENRTLNRRVTLTLTSEITTVTEVETDGDIPELEEGLTATGEKGVRIDSSRIFEYRAPQARMVDGHVIVDLEVTAVDDEIDSSFGLGSLAGLWSYRGSETRSAHRSASGVTILMGTTRIAPMDYYYGDDKTGTAIWLPATDLHTMGRIDSGQTRIYSIIYPKLGDVETVTIQAGPGSGINAFRLTDIPVLSDAN